MLVSTLANGLIESVCFMKFHSQILGHHPLHSVNEAHRYHWVQRAGSIRLPDGELIDDVLLSTPRRTWRRRTGGQVKTWATIIKADMEPLFGPRVSGHAQWAKVYIEVTQDHRVWGASIRLVMPAQPASGKCRHKCKLRSTRQ